MATFDGLVEHLGASAVETGLGAEPVVFRRGHLTARMPLSARTRMPDGRPSPFALATLADMGIGVAVNSTAHDSRGGPTVELTIAMVGDPDPSARFLYVESEAIARGPLTGTGQAVIRDDTGRAVAHALGVMAASGAGTGRAVPYATPFDPRTVRVEPLTDGFERARVAVDHTMANTRGMVHGGVLTGIALTAQEAFHGLARQHSLSAVVRFLRPLDPGLGHVECRSEFVARGRTFRTARTRVLRPDGTVVMEATATSVLAARPEAS
jgi:uncharacterized protein (TIGR00369 family)